MTPHVLKARIVRRYLSVNVGSKSMRVHRLVLMAFVGPCPAGYQGCHSPDPDRTNNRPGNLRWDTPKENSRDTFRQGLARPAHGSKHRFAKLNEERVLAILAYLALGFTQVDTAKVFGVSGQTINHINIGRAWRHVQSTHAPTVARWRVLPAVHESVHARPVDIVSAA